MEKEILFVSRIAPQHGVGGMQIVAWDLARSMAANGLPVSFLTTNIEGRERETYVDGIHLINLDMCPSGIYSPAWWQQSAEYFQKVLSSTRALISVSTAGNSIVRLRSEIPSICQIHGTALSEATSKLRSRRFIAQVASLKNLSWIPRDLMSYRLFDRLVAVGSQVIKDFEHFPYKIFKSSGNVDFIPNGIDERQFRPNAAARADIFESYCVPRSATLIVAAARLHYQKGMSQALKGVAHYLSRHSDARLIIAGDGPEKDHLLKQVSTLNLEEKVQFIGSTSRAELALLLQGADVFLFPSLRNEAGPTLTIMEALATGTPVVCSTFVDCPDDISQSISFANPFNEREIADHIYNAKLRNYAKNKSLLPKKYYLKACADSYMSLIETLEMNCKNYD